MIIFVTEMKFFLFSILSGLLLALSWPNIGGLSYLIFVAFVPLFYFLSEEVMQNNYSRLKLFFCLFSTFFLFNILTTYWIYYATLFGAICAFVINSLLMTLVFYLSVSLRCFRKNNFRALIFISCWITMEYLHLNWDLSWPWLTLGNVFANTTYFVQWYEFTGVLGGSVFILIINILFLKLLFYKKQKYLYSLIFSMLLVFLANYFTKAKSEENKVEVVVVQPNIDPYNEKFTINPINQIEDFIDLARKNITKETKFLIGPETAIQEALWENKIHENASINLLKELQEDFPKLNIIIGATTYKYFANKKSFTARKFINSNNFYDAYNSAIFLSSNNKITIYHKTKLVPGVEKIPFPALLNNFSSLAVNLGGISGSLGSDNDISLFQTTDDKILPLICYESIYGDIISQKNPDFLCVITNDGWWKNTAGYKQHFQYSRLRAIEHRKYVVRSANTGISGLIDNRGNVIYQTNWDEKTAFTGYLNYVKNRTFYNIYGDYIGRISIFVFITFLIINIVKSRIN
tara:strand:+ start:116 stop:1672 length:1557 start_codon:yes stop_codon:yes gene_type:complete